MWDHSLTNHQLSNRLLLPRRGAPAERIMPLFLHALVRFDEVAEVVGLRCCDDAGVDVGAGAEVVEDTGRDGGGDEGKGFFALGEMKFT